ncbi:MAG: hypothetical protein ABDH63_03025 [Candidatus Caldarchaeales archaeon]
MSGPVAGLPGYPYSLVALLAASFLVLLFAGPRGPKPVPRVTPVHRVSRALRYALGEEESIGPESACWLFSKLELKGPERSSGLGLRVLFALTSVAPGSRRWLIRWAAKRG